MLCQVQTPYLEIFDFFVFPIFTDNWGCTIVQIVSKVYFCYCNIYIFYFFLRIFFFRALIDSSILCWSDNPGEITCIIIIRRSKGKKSPAVYDLPFQVAKIYLFRWSRSLLLPGVVERVVLLLAENSGGVLPLLCQHLLRPVLFCKTNLVEISTSMMTLSHCWWRDCVLSTLASSD